MKNARNKKRQVKNDAFAAKNVEKENKKSITINVN